MKSTTYKTPADPRYHVQTRSGLVWDWIAGSDDLATARRHARSARPYRARILDTRTGAIVK